MSKAELRTELERTIDVIDSALVAVGNLPEPEECNYYVRYFSAIGGSFICVDIPFNPDYMADYKSRLGEEWKEVANVATSDYFAITMEHAWLPGVKLLLYCRIDLEGAKKETNLVPVAV